MERSFVISNHHQTLKYYQVNEDLSRSCSTRAGDEKYTV